MASRSPQAKSQSFSTLFFFAAIGLMVAAIVGWSIYWYVASRKTQTALAAWTQREAQAGRNWVCPDQKIGGYPLTVEVSCTNAGFQGTLLDRKLTGTLREFRATAPLFQPDLITAELAPPFTAKTSDGTVDLSATWENLLFEFEGTPDLLNRASLIGQKVLLRGTIGGLDAANGEIGRFNTFVVRLPGRVDNAFEFYLGLKDASLPGLSEYTDVARASAAAVGGTITQANFAGPGSLQDKIEQWRNSNGSIALTTARLASDDQKFDARGTLGLDDEHRVSGELDAEFANLNSVLQQLGFDPMLVTAGSFLSDMFDNSSRVKGEMLGGGRLHLPLGFSDGVLSIGAIKTPVQLPPLY